jgi:hypothetical protein
MLVRFSVEKGALFHEKRVRGEQEGKSFNVCVKAKANEDEFI